MQQEYKEMWNSNHKKYEKSNIRNGKVIYDNWIDKYLNLLPKIGAKVLDLGCGHGNNTQFFCDKGYHVVATDYSETAIENVKKNILQADAKFLDLTLQFPFEDNSFDIAVADLCLHYFSEKQTSEIMTEIKRVLKKDGVLLARVNSMQDKNHGAGQGDKIEENYFFVEGYKKRFFDCNEAQKFFSIVGNTVTCESDMYRYEKSKKTLEIVSVCKK